MRSLHKLSLFSFPIDYSSSSHDVNVEGHGTNLQVDSVPGDLNIGGSGGTINIG